MKNPNCTECHGEGTIHEGGLSIMSKHTPCDCVKVAIGHIITLETLPPQIDYTRPYYLKATAAKHFLDTLPQEEYDKAMKELKKQITEYQNSGAAYYDSLF